MNTVRSGGQQWHISRKSQQMQGELWVTPGRGGQTSPFMAQLNLILFYKSTLPHFLCGTRSHINKKDYSKKKKETCPVVRPSLPVTCGAPQLAILTSS